MANEKRLIDANALLELVQFRSPIDNQNAEVIAGCVDITRRLIENAPTVDAVEVVHGRWVQKEFWTDGGTWRCSECGRQIMFMKGTPITEEMHYCPNCGAKMDGGNEDA